MKFFTSVHRTQVRLKQLLDLGVIKRDRIDSKRNFIYMLPETRSASQIEHLAYVSRLYPYYESMGYHILDVDYEVELVKRKGYRDGIRCDGIFVVQHGVSEPEVYIVECERCHTAIVDKLLKYEQYAKNKEYLSKFPCGMPKLLIITDNPVPRTELKEVYTLPLRFYKN